MDRNSNNTFKPCFDPVETLFTQEKSANVNQRQGRSHHPKRDRSREIDGSGERCFKKRDNSIDKDSRLLRGEQSIVQSVQAVTFPTNNYSSPDHFDNNRQASSMMSPYTRIKTVNSSLAVNSFDGMALNQHNVKVSQLQPMAAGLEIVQSSSSSINPYAFIGIPGDIRHGVIGKGNYCQYGSVPSQENIYFPTVKEVINLTNCILCPPDPSAPPPTTREKPLGCKTVVVGGLPEKITEEMLKEIFERCGTVETIRMSKKNFCNIRFSKEIFVDVALYFSGYRLKIENKNEAAFTGRLHVDYAEAADDKYDYECKQRALQRQARHQKLDCHRSPTPPKVHYTDHEASLICEKLKNKETFTLASSILITWLEKGEISKKNASSFFSMIQSTHSFARKLQLDKEKCEDQLSEAKMRLKKELEGSIHQFTEIEKIYKAASLQKCWDQFTKAQRKNIEKWKKQTEELKNAHLEEVINDRQDEEMDLSDDENCEIKMNSDADKKKCEDEVYKLHEEVYFLKSQLEASQNEIFLMQIELKKRDNQLEACQNEKVLMQIELKKRENQLEACQNENVLMQIELKKRDNQLKAESFLSLASFPL